MTKQEEALKEYGSWITSCPECDHGVICGEPCVLCAGSGFLLVSGQPAGLPVNPFSTETNG